MKLPEDAVLLLCARADSPRTIPGSRFDLHCWICRKRVMIAPSGQKVLKRYGERCVRVTCAICAAEHFEAEIIRGHNINDWDEQIRELRTAGPNTWRERN